MAQAASYSSIETLRSGEQVEIRAQRPDDRAALLAAVGHVSEHSLYRRFFGPKHGFSEREIEFFTHPDFVNHVALVAVIQGGGRSAIAGGGRYIVVQPGRAEVAFTVIDACQGKGLGTALMKHLVVLARAAGLRELVAEVLAENAPMLKVFERSGLPMHTSRQSNVVHVILQVT